MGCPVYGWIGILGRPCLPTPGGDVWRRASLGAGRGGRAAQGRRIVNPGRGVVR